MIRFEYYYMIKDNRNNIINKEMDFLVKIGNTG